MLLCHTLNKCVRVCLGGEGRGGGDKALDGLIQSKPPPHLRPPYASFPTLLVNPLLIEQYQNDLLSV
jgi:hypothetical protein